MSTNKELLEQLELSLQWGDVKTALQGLDTLKITELVGSQIPLYARLCWRSGQAEAGLRYLNPLLKNKSYRATSEDWAEYAMCLNAIGAAAEARDLLQEKCARNSYYNVYMGFSLIYEWDYKAAIPLLEKAIQQEDLPVYQIQVAQVNLLSCYIAEGQADKAEPLRLLLNEKIPEKYQRLRTNLKELGLQLLVIQKKFKEALEGLQADHQQPFKATPEAFYYKKWKTIAEVELGLQEVESLIALRNEAFSTGMWEIARDCEARIATKTGNPVFLKRVYYTTPWSAYRQRILSNFKGKVDLSGPFEFWMSPTLSPKSPYPASSKDFKYTIDVEKGRIGSLPLKKGTLSHRLLRALCSDLFRPHPVGGLFYRLFENERFDLASSPARIYRAVNELRETLSGENIPLEIEQVPKGYRLVAKDFLCLILPSDQVSNKSLLRLQPLKDCGKSEFSAKEAADVLQVSLKTAQRILNESILIGEVEKMGEGSRTLYKWAK